MPLPTDPATLVRLVAAGRIGVGLVALARPQVGGAAFTSRVLPAEGVDGWRMAGARDVVLGVGALMAGRRGERRLRGWAEAGALADLMDVAILSSSSGLRPAARVGGAEVALGATVVGFAAARQLARG